MKNKFNVVVTGGAGFIGSHLCEKLLGEGHFVTAVDNLSTGLVDNISECRLNKRFRFLCLDVNRDFQYPFCEKVDYIFHLSAMVGVKRTLSDPLGVLRDVAGFENVLDLAISTCCRKVIFSSSSEVYGVPVEIPQNECTTPLNARLPYAVVKNIGELYCKAYKKEHGLDFTILRFFNTFGSRQSDNFVVSKFIQSALDGKDITIYGDGSQTRSFFYVEDNIERVYDCIYNRKSDNEVINIGSSVETPIVDLATTIIRLSKSKSKIVFLPKLGEGDMPRRLPDTRKMNNIFSDLEITKLEDGLLETIKYYERQKTN